MSTELTVRGTPRKNTVGRKRIAPEEKHQQVQLTLPPKLATWLRQQPNASAFVAELLRAHIQANPSEEGKGE